jgi:hypothetical protein
MSQPSQPNLSQDELPTQRIPRVKMPAPQSSRQEKADPGAADPPAVMAAEKADAHRELGKDKLDGAQHYRKRVEEAQLPDNLRKAALREVGKLERTSDQSQSGYIRIWLDTVLGLPWSTQTDRHPAGTRGGSGGYRNRQGGPEQGRASGCPRREARHSAGRPKR